MLVLQIILLVEKPSKSEIFYWIIVQIEFYTKPLDLESTSQWFYDQVTYFILFFLKVINCFQLQQGHVTLLN
jgi:hypothetical protein